MKIVFAKTIKITEEKMKKRPLKSVSDSALLAFARQVSKTKTSIGKKNKKLVQEEIRYRNR